MTTRALVTGGAGFIGSHLVELLIDQGLDVVVLDDLSAGKAEFLHPRASFLHGSIVDKELCERACSGVDYVFHMAAMSRSGPSLEALEECLENNVVGTKNVLQASKKMGVRKFVYSASSTCYGNSSVPQGLETRVDLLNPYGWSKFAGEQLCLMYGRTQGLPIVSLRYFNVYGPREPRSGAYALVFGIFRELVGRGLPLEIHGDGLQTRDFIHVSDVARCNLAAAFSPESSLVLNVGTGVATSVLALARMFSSDLYFGPKRPADAQATLADITETIACLGWTPTVTIEAGVREALDSLTRN